MIKLRIIYLLYTVILPLFMGLILYIFFRTNTYINNFLNIGFDIGLPIASINYFLKYLLPDGIFAFSFTNAFLFLWFKEFNLGYMLFPFAFFVSIEVLQLVNLIKGTFDFLDVIVMILFSLFSYYLITKKRRLSGLKEV